ncbi:hypothetical protein EI555_013792 [Monodon monoceros]|uniref:Uncharacterized protein n=1 Tax=Monodon monoceros TaxID=40151 RepID=A0A4U1EGV9_MONMO|nr:hypothetical protein EI555_013792 [Monodon monoceros]
MKKFKGTAKNFVISQGKPLASTNLFVAMLAVLSAKVPLMDRLSDWVHWT